MPWIDLLGNDIHYTDTGSGDPGVLVHGHGSTAACWEPIIAVLSKRFRVLGYDSYDHGFSSNSPRGSEQLVDRIVRRIWRRSSAGSGWSGRSSSGSRWAA